MRALLVTLILVPNLVPTPHAPDAGEVRDRVAIARDALEPPLPVSARRLLEYARRNDWARAEKIGGWLAPLTRALEEQRGAPYDLGLLSAIRARSADDTVRAIGALLADDLRALIDELAATPATDTRTLRPLALLARQSSDLLRPIVGTLPRGESLETLIAHAMQGIIDALPSARHTRERELAELWTQGFARESDRLLRTLAIAFPLPELDPDDDSTPTESARTDGSSGGEGGSP